MFEEDIKERGATPHATKLVSISVSVVTESRSTKTIMYILHKLCTLYTLYNAIRPCTKGRKPHFYVLYLLS